MAVRLDVRVLLSAANLVLFSECYTNFYKYFCIGHEKSLFLDTERVCLGLP